MKLNYADRRNDNNILRKEFKIKDTADKKFKGKLSLIDIKDLKNNFQAKRPNGLSELVIAKDYKIMTYFPDNEKYCMSVMYNNDWKLIQWYFDINRYKCKYDSEVPYSEDLYLDVVLLPDGTYYTLDENELMDAYVNKLISKDEYDGAYSTMNRITKMIKQNFAEINNFTQNSLKSLL